LASEYQNLLYDPFRECFAPGSQFFVKRKVDMLLEFAAGEEMEISQLTWLDVGCGKGDLLRMAQPYFGRAIGCDISRAMISDCHDLNVVHQKDAFHLPFSNASVDWITVVCVFHHIDPPERVRLITEVDRVLRSGGTLAVIEHNPINPVVQAIIRRTPIDRNAQLLSAGATRALVRRTPMLVKATRYFLYVPQRIYRRMNGIERMLNRVPLGGQYVVFARKPA
jgi:SAM-dependent methyltransferase